MDVMMAPAPNYVPTRLYNIYPHPAQDASEKKRYIIMLTSRYIELSIHVFRATDSTLYRNADVPRALVRDMYTKSWIAFDRLVAIFPPGGSIW